MHTSLLGYMTHIHILVASLSYEPVAIHSTECRSMSIDEFVFEIQIESEAVNHVPV